MSLEIRLGLKAQRTEVTVKAEAPLVETTPPAHSDVDNAHVFKDADDFHRLRTQ